MRSHLLPIACILLFKGDSWAFSPIPPKSAAPVAARNSPLFGTDYRLVPTEHYVNNRHSAGDWFHNVRSLPRSSVLREIQNPVLVAAAWSFFVSIVQKLMSVSICERLRAVSTGMCVPATAHGFLVSALGLLLVFRTNSAYQRFYEGRKIWEDILSVSRNLSRMIQLYSKDIGKERKKRITKLLAAYPYLLRHHVRPGCLCDNDKIEKQHRLVLHEPAFNMVDTRYEGDNQSGGNTKPLSQNVRYSRECIVDRRNYPWALLEDENSLQAVARSRNRPLWVCDRIGREIMEVAYTPNYTSRERLKLLSDIEKLTNAVGQCERIHQTAVPLNYARHALRSLTLWLFTLPFALVKDLGLMTGPVVGAIAWLLFGVYQIGYSIEDPFQGSLRLSILCDAIRKDVTGDSELCRNTAFEVEKDDFFFDSGNVKADFHTLPVPQSILGDEQLLFPPKLVRPNGTFSLLDVSA